MGHALPKAPAMRFGAFGFTGIFVEDSLRRCSRGLKLMSEYWFTRLKAHQAAGRGSFPEFLGGARAATWHSPHRARQAYLLHSWTVVHIVRPAMKITRCQARRVAACSCGVLGQKTRTGADNKQDCEGAHCGSSPSWTFTIWPQLNCHPTARS